MSTFTEADRRLMKAAKIGLSPMCDWCHGRDKREDGLKQEISAWAEVARVVRMERDSERGAVADQQRTIDRLLAEVGREKTRFWLLAIWPVCMVAYELYRVRP